MENEVLQSDLDSSKVIFSSNKAPVNATSTSSAIDEVSSDDLQNSTVIKSDKSIFTRVKESTIPEGFIKRGKNIVEKEVGRAKGLASLATGAVSWMPRGWEFASSIIDKAVKGEKINWEEEARKSEKIQENFTYRPEDKYAKDITEPVQKGFQWIADKANKVRDEHYDIARQLNEEANVLEKNGDLDNARATRAAAKIMQGTGFVSGFMGEAWPFFAGGLLKPTAKIVGKAGEALGQKYRMNTIKERGLQLKRNVAEDIDNGIYTADQLKGWWEKGSVEDKQAIVNALLKKKREDFVNSIKVKESKVNKPPTEEEVATPQIEKDNVIYGEAPVETVEAPMASTTPKQNTVIAKREVKPKSAEQVVYPVVPQPPVQPVQDTDPIKAIVRDAFVANIEAIKASPQPIIDEAITKKQEVVEEVPQEVIQNSELIQPAERSNFDQMTESNKEVISNEKKTETLLEPKVESVLIKKSKPAEPRDISLPTLSKETPRREEKENNILRFPEKSLTARIYNGDIKLKDLSNKELLQYTDEAMTMWRDNTGSKDLSNYWYSEVDNIRKEVGDKAADYVIKKLHTKYNITRPAPYEVVTNKKPLVVIEGSKEKLKPVIDRTRTDDEGILLRNSYSQDEIDKIRESGGDKKIKKLADMARRSMKLGEELTGGKIVKDTKPFEIKESQKEKEINNKIKELEDKRYSIIDKDGDLTDEDIKEIDKLAEELDNLYNDLDIEQNLKPKKEVTRIRRTKAQMKEDIAKLELALSLVDKAEVKVEPNKVVQTVKELEKTIDAETEKAKWDKILEDEGLGGIGFVGGQYFDYLYRAGKRAFKTNPTIENLTRLGKTILLDGVKTFQNFSVKMKTVLGKAFEGVKNLVREAWNISKKWLKDERGFAEIRVKEKKDEFGFYSKFEKTVEDKMSGKMEVGQLKKMLQNNGVSPAEIDLILADVKGVETDKFGIPEVKKELKVVTKQDVLDAIKANSVKTKDVVLSEERVKANQKYLELQEAEDIAEESRQRKIEIGNELDAEGVPFVSGNPLRWMYKDKDGVAKDVPDKYIEDLDLGEESLALAERLADTGVMGEDVIEGMPQFPNWTEPGYVPGSYREMFVTAPKVHDPEVKYLTDAYAKLNAKYSNLGTENWPKDDVEAQTYLERLRNFDSAKETWQDGHSQYSSIPNPIVRLRFNDRIVDLPKESYSFTDWKNKVQKAYPDETHTDEGWNKLYKISNGTMSDKYIKGKRILFVEEIQGPAGDTKWVAKVKIHSPNLSSAADLAKYANNQLYHIKVVDSKKEAENFVSSFKNNFPDVSSSIERTVQGEQGRMPDYLQKRIYDIGVKKALMLAKQGGYDGVAWTTGEMQADRYNLSTHIDKVTWGTASMSGEKIPTIYLKDHTPIHIEMDNKGIIRGTSEGSFVGEKLENVIGQEIAKKILTEDSGELKGLDLKVGGEGLKHLYDKQLPSLFKKYGKEEVKEIKLNTGDEHKNWKAYYNDANAEWEITDSTNKLIETVPDEGQTAQEAIETAYETVGKNFGKEVKVPYIPITSSTPPAYTLFSDPFMIQTGTEVLKHVFGKAKESTKELWDKAVEKSTTAKSIDETTKATIQGIKEGLLDPERIMSKDEFAKKIIYRLFDAEEGRMAFEHKHMTEFEESAGSIKPDSAEANNIGNALNTGEGVSGLTPKEKKAYDFFKQEYDFLINEAARRMCGSEESYQKVLKLATQTVVRRRKISELTPEQKEIYNLLKAEAIKLRKGKKVSELNEDELEDYEEAKLAAQNYLGTNIKKGLTEGEAEAYDLLRRKIEDYLPRLFDKEDLIDAFTKEVKITEEKLSKATKKGNITRYKNRLNKLNEAITQLNGGEWVRFRQLPRDIQFRFFNKRKGKAGYSLDAIKAYQMYIYGIARKMFDEPAMKEVAELYKNVNPALKPYTKDLIEYYMGYGKNKDLMSRVSSAITAFEWIRTLGLNPRSAITNLTQRLNTVVYVGEKYSAKAEKMMLQDMTQKTLDRAHGIQGTYLTEELFDKTGIAREVPKVLMEGTASNSLEKVRRVTGFMFNKIELGNRKHAFIAGYLKAKDNGMSEEQAIKEGIKIVHKTQFRYGRLGNAKWLRSNIGRIVLQFSSYTLKQAQFLYSLYKESPQKFLKYFAYATGINYTLQELFDTDMSNAIGFGINFGEALNIIKSLGEGDTRGAYRHLRQTFQEGGGLLPSGLGPAVTSGAKIASKVPEGKGLEQLGKELTPVIGTRIKQAYMAVKDAEGGRYPIYNKDKHRMYYLDARQLAQRTLGPKTEKERSEAVKSEEIINLEQERKEVIKDIIKLIADDKIDKAVDLMMKYEITPGDAAIENEITNRLFTKEEQGKVGAKEEYQLMREGKLIQDEEE